MVAEDASLGFYSAKSTCAVKSGLRKIVSDSCQLCDPSFCGPKCEGGDDARKQDIQWIMSSISKLVWFSFFRRSRLLKAEGQSGVAQLTTAAQVQYH